LGFAGRLADTDSLVRLSSDGGMSMVRPRYGLNKRLADMTWLEAVELTAMGGKVRPSPEHNPGMTYPAVVIRKVLCCFCREMHSPGEVEQCMVLPRKEDVKGQLNGSASTALDPGPLKQYSELWSFLTSSTYPDGTPRLTGRISLSFESGMLRLSLNDDETGSYATLNSRSYLTILEEAELRLADGSLSFKPSKYAQKGRARK